MADFAGTEGLSRHIIVTFDTTLASYNVSINVKREGAGAKMPTTADVAVYENLSAIASAAFCSI
jgi:hypothetical protein